jgi:HlyD family secretion protein
MKTLVVGTLLATGLATGWYFWPEQNGQGEKKVETRRVKVERGDITLFVTASGEIKPLKEVEIKSKASGQVVRFKKDPGDPVEKGELIAELDKKTEQRNLGLQESNLLAAEANLELTKLKYAADLKTAESEAAAAGADSLQKRAESRRMEKLSGELITESEISAVKLAARLSEEKSKQAEAALTLIRGRKEADEKLALAEVQKVRVAVEDAKERLRDTELRAPMKGILLKKLVEEGQIVASGISATAGGTAVAIVADVSKLLVEANVDETDIARVRKGQPVEISLMSGSNDRFKGTVDLILPKGEIDSNIIVFKVRIGMEGDLFGRTYAGMTASIEIRVDDRKGALLVPSEAVKIENRKPVVYVPDGTGSKPVAVKTGIDDGIKTEITDGLDENAEVFVTHSSIPEQKPSGRSRLRF